MSTASRVRVYLGCSLDGCIAGPDHDLSFLQAPGPSDAPPADPDALDYASFMEQIGAILMGRTTHDVVAGMGIDWPYGETPVLVATTRALEPIAPTVQARSGDIRALVDAAKSAAG